jgi:hypothetical protein
MWSEVMTSNPSAVGQLDIGAPDSAAARIMALITAYASRPCSSTEEHVELVRGLAHIKAASEDAWRAGIAKAYYAPDGTHVPLAEIGELNATDKPMARSTVQHHVGIGMDILEMQDPTAYRVANRERSARAALVHGKRRKSRRSAA